MSELITVTIDQDLEDIIPSFLENRNKDIALINQSLESQDYEAIESIAHKLAGNAGSYGFDDMGDIGVNLEKACRDKNETLVKSLAAKYKYYLEHLQISYT
jgi:HPt (histidine-containing phosphotransfer) domain-containing protein